MGVKAFREMRRTRRRYVAGFGKDNEEERNKNLADGWEEMCREHYKRNRYAKTKPKDKS